MNPYTRTFIRYWVIPMTAGLAAFAAIVLTGTYTPTRVVMAYLAVLFIPGVIAFVQTVREKRDSER